MIYDCILYNGEYEMLEMRINEMKGLDVIHVIVEADYTFTGIKKPIRFHQENEQKIIRSQLDKVFWRILKADDGVNTDPWENEYKLRNFILTVLNEIGVKDNDSIVICDADEIPRRSVIEQYNVSQGFCALIMDKYGYYLNCMEGRQTWNLPRIMPFSYLKTTTPQEVRSSGYPNQIDNAGWHFSYMGGVERMIEKFKSFAHQEESVQKVAKPEILAEKLKNGQSLWGNDYWQFVEIDDTYPIDVVQNTSKYKHLIYEKPLTWEQIDGWFDFEMIYDAAVDAAVDGDVFVEIGVYKGKSTCYLLDKIKQSGKAIGLIAIDNFTMCSSNEVRNNIKKCGLESSLITIIESDSDKAAEMFSNKSVKFCFIDGSHEYEQVKKDLQAWLPKIESNGLIAGHDYEYVKVAVHDVLGDNIVVYGSSWVKK